MPYMLSETPSLPPVFPPDPGGRSVAVVLAAILLLAALALVVALT